MRKRRTYIIILIILISFFLIMFLMFGIDNIRQDNYTTTLIVGDSTTWTNYKKKWINVDTNDSIQKLNWKEYNVYVDNKKNGKYLLWYGDKWYVFDKKKNAVNLDGGLFAYRSNHSIDVIDFTGEEIDDRTYIDYVLEDNDLSLSSQFTSEFKTSFDFDNDGLKEDFYIISNAFPLDFEPEKIFSLVFMVKDSNVYYLYNDISKNNSFNGCKPFFTTFLDVNSDKVYEIILSCGRYSSLKQVDMLYKFENNEFKIAISNQ